MPSDRDYCLHDLLPGQCAACLGHDTTLPAIDTAPTPPRHRRHREHVIRGADLPTPTRRAYAPLPRGRSYPALCVNPGCRGTDPDGNPRDGRPTDGRANICPTCEDRARDNLTAVAAAWPDLEAELSTTVALTDDPVRSTPAPGIRLNEEVLEAISTVTGHLVFLARTIKDERGAEFPLTQPTVPEIARWIARTHVPWLAVHSDPEISAALCTESRAAKATVYRLAYSAPARRVRVPIRCKTDVPDDAGRAVACGAMVHATIHPGEAILDDDVLDAGDDAVREAVASRAGQVPDLVCDAGHVIPADVWVHARNHVPADRAAVARLLKALSTPTAHTTTTDRTTP